MTHARYYSGPVFRSSAIFLQKSLLTSRPPPILHRSAAALLPYSKIRTPGIACVIASLPSGASHRRSPIFENMYLKNELFVASWIPEIPRQSPVVTFRDWRRCVDVTFFFNFMQNHGFVFRKVSFHWTQYVLSSKEYWMPVFVMQVSGKSQKSLGFVGSGEILCRTFKCLRS